MTAKSGFVNPKPIIEEIAELSGLDPARVVVDPQPKPPEEPNISFRFSGKDDMMSPAVVAILKKHGKLPSIQDLQEAIHYLEAAQNPSMAQAAQAPGPAGQPGAPHPPGVPGAPAQPGQPAPPPHPSNLHKNEGFSLGDRVAKRSRDISGG